jgi:hypothetical protein
VLTTVNRWLENPDASDVKVRVDEQFLFDTGYSILMRQEFVTAQNALAFDHLSKCDFREKYRAALTKLFDYERYGCPFKRGGNLGGLQSGQVMV